jgi:indolepyruvate ferredoxin oxidoreductase, beta subunit
MTSAPDPRRIVNVVIAGLGGQGVVKASDILADAAFRAGYDVKKSELHGMSQRGGSVASDVRFGLRVWSPMVPAGEADILLVVDDSQIEVNRAVLRPDGLILAPGLLPAGALKAKKSLNVALLGALAAHLAIAPEHWLAALHANLAPKLHRQNEQAFALGRAATEVR